MARDLSVVVFGATGITGRGVARLPGRAAEDERLQLGGRGPRPGARSPASSASSGSARRRRSRPTSRTRPRCAAMAARTRVVLNLVGPYTLHGEPVIEACIAGGAHYVDLTGEIPFVRRMIDAGRRAGRGGRRQDRQRQRLRGAAAPTSLVTLAAETARERWSEELATADLDADLPIARAARSAPPTSISGGTLQSLAEIAPATTRPPIADPGALIEDEELAQRVRNVSPIAIAPAIQRPGRGGRPDDPGAVHQPGRDPPHRGAARRRGRPRSSTPSATARGSTIPGGAGDDAAALPSPAAA